MSRSADDVATRYEEELARGLVVSGEGRDFFARGRVEHLARCLREPAFPVRSVLDFGCGTGDTCPLLREILGAERVTGTDSSEESLAAAREHHAGDAIGFVTEAELARCDGFDLVYSNGTFHHIPPDERNGVVRGIHSRLRPGGLFALFENNPWNPGTRFVMSRIPFDRDAVVLAAPEAKGLLRSAGFEIVRNDFLFVFPRSLRWLRRLEALLSPYPIGAQYLVLGRR